MTFTITVAKNGIIINVQQQSHSVGDIYLFKTEEEFRLWIVDYIKGYFK